MIFHDISPNQRTDKQAGSNKAWEQSMVSLLGQNSTRCSYEGCSRPHESSQFFKIREGKTTGGQDWTELVGRVLCNACYVHFQSKGTLERTGHSGKSGDASSPGSSSKRPAPRHGTSSSSSHSKRQKRQASSDEGESESEEDEEDEEDEEESRLCGSTRRCSYEGCKNPHESGRFFKITKGKTAGGQDWTELVGSVLCDACHLQFRTKGTLERTGPQRKPIPASARRCSYEGCPRPLDSRDFYLISEGKTCGGQDWTELVGRVLCSACYHQFKKKGTLERTGHRNVPPDASVRRCSYEGCKSPHESSQFFKIREGKTTGGQDWTELVGRVMCNACHLHFKSQGTLERTGHRNVPPGASARRCSYEGCPRPLNGNNFYHVKEVKTTGGQDWTELVGRVLCNACYVHFKSKGTLERTGRSGKSGDASSPGSSSKRPAPQHGTSSSSSHSKRQKRQASSDEGESEEEHGQKESRGASGSTLRKGAASRGLDASAKPGHWAGWSGEPWGRLVRVDDETEVHTLSKEVTTVGRSRQCAVVIDITDPNAARKDRRRKTMSRMHLRLTYDSSAGKCLVKDESINGTKMETPNHGSARWLPRAEQRKLIWVPGGSIINFLRPGGDFVSYRVDYFAGPP